MKHYNETLSTYCRDAVLLLILNYYYLHVCGSQVTQVTRTSHGTGGQYITSYFSPIQHWNYFTERTDLNNEWIGICFSRKKNLAQCRQLNLWFSNGFSASWKLKVNRTVIMQNKHSKENKLKIHIRHMNVTLRIICDMNWANFIIFLYNLNMINTVWQKEYRGELCFLVTSNAYILLIYCFC